MQANITLQVGRKPGEAPRKPATARDGCRWCSEPVAEDGHATQRYVIGHGLSHEACYQATRRTVAVADGGPVVQARQGPAFTDLLKRPAHRTVFGPCTANGYHRETECML